MFYVFNNIERKDIFDDALKVIKNKYEIEIFSESNNLEYEEKERNFLSKLISFSIEKGIYGNLWKKFILYSLIFNENPFTLSIERDQEVEGNIEEVQIDLEEYYGLYNAKSEAIDQVANFTFHKKIESPINDLIDKIMKKIGRSYGSFEKAILEFYSEKGVGDMAVYKAFRIENNKLLPIKNVSNISFDDLIGYEYQKEQLIENTSNFINGKSYNNVLLYGDSGTGKSTSIKATLNKFFPQGLRIIEIYKHQMSDISKIISTLKQRPYFYVIYMDDLSFEEDEIEYKYLKSIIEGGIEPKPDNVVIYATSNRKHLIKETSKDNVLDDLHRNETQAEKLSLAYRFGLQIYYGSLSPKDFKNMVLELAKKNDIKCDETTLITEASKWELTYGSLSGRCAVQFINHMLNIK